MSGTVPVSEIVKSLTPEVAAKVRLLFERGVKIPPQPRVLEELRQHLLRKEFDVRLLSKVIQKDAGLTAMLFKVVGSAAYRQHQPFDSVEQILHAVGVKQTFNLAQAILLAKVADGKTNARALEAFWARSRAVAQLAMLIADDRISICNIFPDQAYLAGIFHDVGVPLLMQRFPTYCAEMSLGDDGKWIDLAEEDRKFNADHCAVGYIVARHWMLPDFICDAIRNHHEISCIGLHVSRTMVAILDLAVEIYHRDLRTGNPEWESIQREVAEELGLHMDDLPEFVDVILERYHQA